MRSATDSAAGIAVQALDEFAGVVSEAWLRAVCQTVLIHEGVQRRVSVVIADDDTLRALNRKYRGIDKTTDVLSFAFDNQGEYYGEADAASDWAPDTDAAFILPPDESAGLGEVIVSYPQALRQAQAAARPIERELAHLIAHGILHLLGHDHMQTDEETLMNAKEVSILEILELETLERFDGADCE